MTWDVDDIGRERTRRARVVAIAGDAGGARAVGPVISHLRTTGAQVECRAYDAALEIWTREGLCPRPPSGGVAGFSHALVATSVNALQHELHLVDAARAAGIRSVAVVDFWANYRARFTGPDGRLVLPDAIAVMDEVARSEAVAAGLGAERVVVTGQPAFDALGDVRRGRERIREEVRRRAGVGTELLILYASQPLYQLYSAEQLGTDPRSALPDIVVALGEVLGARRREATLIVKLHPREMSEPFVAPAVDGTALRVRVVRDDTIAPRELVAASDLVVGISTVLLMEACLIGVPVVSYQPRMRWDDPLPANRFGWTLAVREPAMLTAAIDAELFDPAARQKRAEVLASIALPSGATTRVADLLLRDDR